MLGPPARQAAVISLWPYLTELTETELTCAVPGRANAAELKAHMELMVDVAERLRGPMGDPLNPSARATEPIADVEEAWPQSHV